MESSSQMIPLLPSPKKLLVGYLQENKIDFSPFAIGPKNYTVVGENREAVQKFQETLKPHLDRYAVKTGKELLFTDNLKNEDDLLKWIRGGNYQGDDEDNTLLFAIGLPQGSDPYDYTIYMSPTFPDNIPQTDGDQITKIPQIEEFNMYTSNGFMTLQTIVAEHILKEEAPGSSIEVFFTMGEIDEFTLNK